MMFAMDERADTRAETTPRKRRWWRFSLRTMLLASTAVCVWFGMLASSARRQQQAVEAIQKVYGTVTYDWQFAEPSQQKPGGPTPPGPQWLRRLLGPHYFDDVVEVSLNNNIGPTGAHGRLAAVAPHLHNLPRLRELDLISHDLTLEEAAHIGRLKQLELLRTLSMEITVETAAEIANATGLREIDFSNVIVTPAALRKLARLPRLESFSLDCLYMNVGRTITITDEHKLRDAGAQAISQLRQLRTLRIFQTMVTDEGVSSLATLPHLQTLTVSSRQVTSTSLETLSRLKQIRELGIWCWHVSDDDLPTLADFPALNSLMLIAPVSDQGIRHLEKLTNLTHLTLDSDGITDAGLSRLHALKNLVFLNVSETKVTRGGPAMQQLQQALRKCTIMQPRVKHKPPQAILLRPSP